MVTCPCCSKEAPSDRLFCHWCDAFLVDPKLGKRAGLFPRWFASVLDPIIGGGAVALAFLLPSVTGESIGVAIGIIASTIVAVWFIVLFRKGQTPGKLVMGEKVVLVKTGAIPGFWRMLFRELLGKFVSGSFFALGFFWAIWDRDHQAWHDKIFGTVVIRRS